MTTSRLILTNGDSAASAIRAAGIDGDLHPWRDVLHEGPVPSGLGFDDLSRLRADHLATAYRLDLDEVQAGFAQNSEVLGQLDRYDEVILWFEHDLYDQLQRLQLLVEWTARSPAPTLTFVHDAYQITSRDADALKGAFNARLEVRTDQAAAAGACWAAFTAPTPEGWINASGQYGSLLGLDEAMVRLAEELPGSQDGLSRTERTVLQAITEGHQQPGPIFRYVLEHEAHPFLGDLGCWRVIDSLCQQPRALVQRTDGDPFAWPMGAMPDAAFLGQTLDVTPRGRAVLAGDADVAALPGVDRWLGGTHIREDAPWRWDPELGVVGH